MEVDAETVALRLLVDRRDELSAGTAAPQDHEVSLEYWPASTQLSGRETAAAARVLCWKGDQLVGSELPPA